ncbi:MAG: fumarate hydratase [Kiritimatiellia bacterium]
MTDQWISTLLELIHRTSCDLPADIETALRTRMASEKPGSRARATLRTLLENAALARRREAPLCQDTGTLTFFWKIPQGARTDGLASATRIAVSEATRRGWLRRNTVDSLTGKSVDTNVTDGAPVLHFSHEDCTDSTVWLLQKGGGSENMSAQFSLPDESMRAGRDLQGVRATLLHAVWQAQGYGCAPGVLGVCIGADRAEGHLVAKTQLLRPLTDRAPEPKLAELEERVLQEANELGIGPMGLEGKTTLLGVKIAVRPRVPASYFVTVAYMCWACRRRGVRAQAADGAVIEWLG